jgi:hypothetical protein
MGSVKVMKISVQRTLEILEKRYDTSGSKQTEIVVSKTVYLGTQELQLYKGSCHL